MLQNLYGEKEWIFISDRFLPDRSVSIIAQRYWRLCLLIYRGHGIHVDQTGNFTEPAVLPNGIDDFDEEAILRTLNQVQKPIVFGLYRWSMEEDIMLLKAVPLMGRMFAEIGKRFVPHRDRGALRKRYQVLERRVKGATKRDKKSITETNKRRVGPIIKTIKRAEIAQPIPPPRGGLASSSFGQVTANKAVTSPSSYFPRTAAATSAGLIPFSRGASQVYSSNTADSYSSSALGQVIEGEWSQMSNIKKILDVNETGKSRFEEGNAGQVHPAASHFLPSMDYNNDNSFSGLSMLGAADHKLQSDSAGTMRKGESIMKSVLKRTNESMTYQGSSSRPDGHNMGGYTNTITNTNTQDNSYQR